MIDFIQDDDRLRDERKKAKKNKDKYVGMSSDAMGFRGGSSRGGFESGWQDKWPSSSGGAGRSVTPTGSGGFRDDSPTDFDSDYHSRRSPVDEFRDNSDNTHGDQNSVQDLGYSTINSPSSPTAGATSAASTAPATKPNKVRKPIDLGAAATYAQNAAAQSKPAATVAAPAPAAVPQNKQLIDDLFNTSNGADDDFDPRGGVASAAVAPSGNANGDFGNFTAAFGNPEPAAAAGVATAASGNDGFADFTSAFTSSSSSAGPAASNSLSDDLFASLPAASSSSAAPAFQPAARPPSNPSFDLIGGGGISGPSGAAAPPSFNAASLFGGATPASPVPQPQPTASSNNASAFDLLSGLDMGSSSAGPAPSLMNAPPLGGAGLINNGSMSLPPTLLPQGPTATGMDLFSNGGGSSSTAGQNNNGGGPNKGGGANTKDVIPQSWGNVGHLNIDLDNLSLAGGTAKKNTVPMNAMKTSSSSESPMSPSHGAFPGSAAGSMSGSQQNNFLQGSNNLL